MSQMASIRGISSSYAWDYENAFYWFSPYERIAKLIAHWKIYEKILEVPGDVLELGVYKGASLIRWATFREISENARARKIVGFDAFGAFPLPNNPSQEDLNFVENFENAGGQGLQEQEIKDILNYKHFENITLVKGDVKVTLPEYLHDNPQTRIALLHLDMDVFEPTKFALELLWERVSQGGCDRDRRLQCSCWSYRGCGQVLVGQKG
jgi:hypothetical protein